MHTPAYQNKHHHFSSFHLFRKITDFNKFTDLEANKPPIWPIKPGHIAENIKD